MLLVVAIYLSLWTAYALNGLTSHGRYRQYDPGAPVTAMGAEFRLVSLVQTTQVTDSSTGDISAPAGERGLPGRPRRRRPAQRRP